MIGVHMFGAVYGRVWLAKVQNFSKNRAKTGKLNELKPDTISGFTKNPDDI